MELEAIDVIDRKIIDQLRHDGRRSFGQLARYVGVSEASVRQRYRRLLNLGVVQVVGMPNSPRLGFVEVHLSITVIGTPVETVARALAALPEVKFVGGCTGESDLTVDVSCRDHTELTTFLTDTVRTVRGINTLTSSFVLEILKDEYVWSGFRDHPSRPTKPHDGSLTR